MPTPRSRKPSAGRRIDRLFAPVDISSLVFFRVAFGAIMLWEVWRYLSKGRVARYWIEPVLNFKYYGFEWVHAWPGVGMYVHWVGLGVVAALIAVGLWYRAAAVLFFVGFTYTFLLEQARYLNHFYLIILVSFLLIFLPAHRSFSLDALRKPALRSGTAPAWSVWLLRAQLGIVYVYAGLAKLNADWLAGQPMRRRLARRDDYPVLGQVAHEEWAVALFTYGGIAFNLLVVPALLWRRTRVPAFLAAVAFHLTNEWMYSIGIFPLFMIVATTIFFEPDWPRKLLGRVRRPVGVRGRTRRAAAGSEGGTERTLPVVAGGGTERRLPVVAGGAPPRPSPRPRRAGLVAALLGAWLLIQLLVPLRHHAYPSDALWTQEGHRFSWRMMLRSTSAREVAFLVTHPETGSARWVDPEEVLPRWQVRNAFNRPDMVLQFAHFLARDAEARGFEGVEVRARVLMSLNGRPARPLVDPEVDLASVRRSLRPASWLLPLDPDLEVPGAR